jgi:aldose 1-epimerase
LEPKQAAAGILTLSRGAGRCELLPTLGGSITAWRFKGQEMLRSASSLCIAANDPFGMASFPLVPFSNRIGDGRFEWQGERFALARNFPPEPHAIHGVGFQRPWHVQARATDSVTLALLHRPDDSWPFAFEAQQRIIIGDGTLAIELSAVNLADRAVPLAFGHHPYFPRAGALLKFRAQGVWMVGEDGLPSVLAEPCDRFDFANASPVARGDVDHCFVGWDRMSQIAWLGRPLALEITASDALPCAVVCIQSDLDGFCFEPVPHSNDVVNRRASDYAMPVIEPGKHFTASILFRAVEREQG